MDGRYSPDESALRVLVEDVSKKKEALRGKVKVSRAYKFQFHQHNPCKSIVLRWLLCDILIDGFGLRRIRVR